MPNLINHHLQNKIRIGPSTAGQVAAKLASLRSDTTAPIPEASDESEETRKLINGIRALGESNDCECLSNDEENERPNKDAGCAKRAEDGTSKSGAQNGQSVALSRRIEQQDSVFKSANWLSDSELIFSLSNQVGGLVRALRVFQELDIGIKHVESRPSKRRDSEFEIFVDIDCDDRDKMRKLVHHLR